MGENTIIKSITRMLEFIEDVKLTLDLDEDTYSDKDVITRITKLVIEYDKGK